MTEQRVATLDDLLTPAVSCFASDLARWLIEPGTPAALAEAMRYCTAGGKRLRPALVYLSAEAAGGGRDELTGRSAVAVELVHCYSLVHDDLPAMDDDSLRRGHPTAHVKFGEAMAILVGDALLTRAFGVLGCDGGGRLVAELARWAGPDGMIAGQVADMDLCVLPEGMAGVEYVHLRKTAALILAAVRMGAISADADDVILDATTEFARLFGLAYQIVDDLLDVIGQAAALGKTPGKDVHLGRRTAVSELGLEAAGRLADRHVDGAIAALRPLGPAAAKLAALTRCIRQRDR